MSQAECPERVERFNACTVEKAQKMQYVTKNVQKKNDDNSVNALQAFRI